MSEVKRYDAGCDYAGEDEMVQNQFGDYVTFEDYAALKTERDALAAENAALRDFCKNASFDADFESVLFGERGGFTDALNCIKTPATEAFLLNAQADAIDNLWKKSLIDTALCLAGIGTFDKSDDRRECEWIVRDEIKERVEEFSAQLRAQAEALKGGE